LSHQGHLPFETAAIDTHPEMQLETPAFPKT